MKPGAEKKLPELPPRPGPQPGLLLELARAARSGSSFDAVVGDVEAAGRDLEQDRAGGERGTGGRAGPVLGVDRDDRDRARMAGDVALEREPSARSMVSTRNVR